MLHREGFGEPCGSNNDCQLRYFISPHNRQRMKKGMLVMAGALLVISSCTKKSSTAAPGGSASSSKKITDYIPAWDGLDLMGANGVVGDGYVACFHNDSPGLF